VLGLGKEGREKQNGLKAKLKFHRAILFWHLRHVVGVSAFRIDGRTIKRELLSDNSII
jgi:hypothetical protein